MLDVARRRLLDWTPGACPALFVVLTPFGRVLIVDDERHIRDVLRDFLTAMGDEVATAPSGAAALEMVSTFQPDVILRDMVMPGMSGADLFHALRTAGITVPVILISATRSSGRRDSSGSSRSRSIFEDWPRSSRRRSTKEESNALRTGVTSHLSSLVRT